MEFISFHPISSQPPPPPGNDKRSWLSRAGSRLQQHPYHLTTLNPSCCCIVLTAVPTTGECHCQRHRHHHHHHLWTQRWKTVAWMMEGGWKTVRKNRKRRKDYTTSRHHFLLALWSGGWLFLLASPSSNTMSPDILESKKLWVSRTTLAAIPHLQLSLSIASLARQRRM